MAPLSKAHSNCLVSKLGLLCDNVQLLTHILTQIVLSQRIFVHLTRTPRLASSAFSRCSCTRLCLFITSFSSSQLIFLASVSLALSAFSTLGEEVSSQPREGISSVLQNKILIIVFVFSFSMKINVSKILLHSCLMTQDQTFQDKSNEKEVV